MITFNQPISSSFKSPTHLLITVSLSHFRRTTQWTDLSFAVIPRKSALTNALPRWQAHVIFRTRVCFTSGRFRVRLAGTKVIAAQVTIVVRALEDLIAGIETNGTQTL